MGVILTTYKSWDDPPSSEMKNDTSYNLLINGIYWEYNPLTNHLLTSWDIQVPQLSIYFFGCGGIEWGESDWIPFLLNK